MAENIYDDPYFFEEYSQMARSVEGLSAAGEWHAFRKLLPNLAGKRVLDLGCGYGWHCRYAAECGATEVVGVDVSKKMLKKARAATPFINVTYVQSSIELYPFEEGAFDVVLSSLAFHYIEHYDVLCQGVRSCLVPGGRFVFSVEHPIFTAEGSQDWVRSTDGRAVHWPVDGYFFEGSRRVFFLGSEMTKYHRTTATYFKGLRDAGFTVEDLVEPTPDPDLLKKYPAWADELRRPMMLLMSAVKK